MSIKILGIESSCDETAASVSLDGRTILSNIVSSQVEEHKKFGGVVPEIASRKHIEAIYGLADQALENAGLTREEIDGLSMRIRTNNECIKCKTADYDNGLIIEMTAKNESRFYLHHDKFGDSNEVELNLEANKEYYIEASLNQQFSITVASNVADADVYVDNQYKGKSNSGYTLTVNDIMVGQHKIRVEYGALKREVEVLVTDTDIYFKVEVDTQLTRPQYVVFQIVPVSASIAVGDKSYPLDSEGIAQMVLYNGSYMLPETVITVVVAFILLKIPQIKRLMAR